MFPARRVLISSRALAIRPVHMGDPADRIGNHHLVGNLFQGTNKLFTVALLLQRGRYMPL